MREEEQDGWMDGWIDGWMDGHTSDTGSEDILTDPQTYHRDGGPIEHDRYTTSITNHVCCV